MPQEECLSSVPDKNLEFEVEAKGNVDQMYIHSHRASNKHWSLFCFVF